MTMTWTVGIDGSSDALAALAWAASIAEETNGVVRPLTAWHVPLPFWLTSGRRPIEVDQMGLRAEAELLLADTVKHAGEANTLLGEVLGESIVVEDHPAPALLARSAHGDTIVVGRRGIGRLQHRLLGSVSQHLATHTAGPLVVVPNDWTPTPCRRIVVGFDGSEHASQALRWALDMAPQAATVTALIAIDIIPWLQPGAAQLRFPDEIQEAKDRLNGAVDAVDPDGRAVRQIELHGARQMLAQASGESDLVVVGPRGLGGAARAMLGSVTTWLLHASPCPIAVVPTD